jgi:ribonuclease P protein component
MVDHRFRKEDRVLLRRDFARLHETARFAADHVLVIRAIRNELGRTRLGLAVSRRTGNAVVRNRWKRRIREAFRTRRDRLPAGWDLLVRPRRGAVAEFGAIADSLVRLANRISRTARPSGNSSSSPRRRESSPTTESEPG